MNLWKVTVYNGFSTFYEFIMADGYPGNKRVIKYLSMHNYCGHEMTDADYKEFVVDNGHVIDYVIENIEKVDFITIPKKLKEVNKRKEEK
jgi:hypothetical protein